MNPFWTVTLFWVATVVCILIALAFVLPALLRQRSGETRAARRDINIAVYRDQLKEMESDRDSGLLSAAQFETAKAELEARLAEDALAQESTPETAPVSSRKLGYTLGAVLPAAAFGLYFLLGNPTSLMAIADAQSGAQAGAAEQGGHDIMALIQQVEEKTRQNPQDGEAWTILAKTYAVVGHWPEALQAYEKAMALRPDVPAVMSGYAEALAITNNRVMAGRPLELVTQALEKDPDDLKGLELAAIAAFQDKGYAKAALYFKRLHKLLPPESPYAQDVLNAQKEAERMVNAALTGMDNLSDQSTDKPASTGAKITGKVHLAPALKAKVSPNDTVFLFARTGAGGPPVAAIRATAAAFPIDFVLDDSMAMNPENRLSKFKEVNLVARISKSGEPMGATGDLEGQLKAVPVGAQDVVVTIETIRP